MKRSEIPVLFMNRLLDAGVFTNSDDFYCGNMSPMKGIKKDFWIRETYSGDTIKRGTNYRTARITPSISYTIAVPINTGTALLDQKEEEIKACFDLWDSEKCNFAGRGFAGEIKNIRVSEDFSNEIWCFRSVILLLSVHLYSGKE